MMSERSEEVGEEDQALGGGFPAGRERPNTDDRTRRMTRTVALIFSWICMGLFSEITGPTLPYLKYRVSCDYEEISRALFSRSVGFLLGSTVGGVLCEKHKQHIDLMLATALVLAGFGTAVVPWCRSLALLAFMVCLDGIGKGLLASGGNSYVIQIWDEKASVPVHALHFAFGIGALIAPQIVRPFIPDTLPNANSSSNPHAVLINNLTSYLVNPESNGSSTYYHARVPIGEESQIEVPYTIVAAITLLCAGFFIGLWLFSRRDYKKKGLQYSNDKSILKILSPSSCVHGHGSFGGLMLTFMFVFFGLVVGAERAYGKFLFSFAISSEGGFTKDEATGLDSAFWASFTTGRGLATVFARWTPPLAAIFIEIVVNISSAAMLVAMGYSVKIVLWIFTCTFGAFLSPLFPAGMAWANQYMEMTAVVTSVAFIGSAIGAMFFSWVSGYLFEYHGPRSLMYLMLGYAVFLCLFFIFIYVLARRHGKKKTFPPGNENEASVELKRN